MSTTLVVHVRFHDGRYHGEGDWPPCPARLFQALVAGVGLGGPLDADVKSALEWLEKLPPPLLGAPYAWRGQRVMLYMPNNDLDVVGGDPRRVGKIRTAEKVFHPLLFDAGTPFLYVWPAVPEAERSHASAICSLADRIYQVGRGVDMAWAWGEVLEHSQVEALLASYPGQVFRPSTGTGGEPLRCPHRGSLASVENRYREYRQRFVTERKGKAVRLTFRQPPQPSFRTVAYDSPPSRRVYELRTRSSETSFEPWPLARASQLVTCLRDGAVDRLRKALPGREAEIDRILVGRKPDGTNDGPTTERVKIVPLPSIGHHNADHAIRRVFVEVPAACPLQAQDVHWAFSGLEPLDAQTGEVFPIVLTPAADGGMMRHYGIGDDATTRVWRTVTPTALPARARRRRIEPTRVMAEAKDGTERATERAHAAGAVTDALRHAGVRTPAESICVQREPFEADGERVEAFALGTRFARERLWHVEVKFKAPVAGPLVIGDGRFLGLGVMAPVKRTQGVHAFAVESGLVAASEPVEVARALRRAVIARVQHVLGPGKKPVPPFFTGHAPDGSPATAVEHPHLTFVFDPERRRLLILAPHVVDRRATTRDEVGHLAALDQALVDFRELRAGAAGRLMLRASLIPDEDPLFAPSSTWDSVTTYLVTRHAKRVGAYEALAADLRAECLRRGLPEPSSIAPYEASGIPGSGLVGRVRLQFKSAISGPIVLGKTRHLGGGLFAGRRESS